MDTCFKDYTAKLRAPHQEVRRMSNKPDNENIIKRVYQSIKEQVITCEVAPGERLNIEQLAEQLRVSTTPVRESLNRLVAEDLIVMIPRMGFFMKGLMEPELRDLYELNLVLLQWSIDQIKKKYSDGVDIKFPHVSLIVERLQSLEEPAGTSLVKFTSDAFAYLASQTGNSEITLRVRNINDRLHYIRLCESEMIENAVQHVLPMLELFSLARFDELSEGLAEYHKNRLALLPEVIKTYNLSSHSGMRGYGSQLTWPV